MLTKTTKLVSVAGLLVTAALWSCSLPLRFLVASSLLLVATHALGGSKYQWALAPVASL
jgi:hypothetical protein